MAETDVVVKKSFEEKLRDRMKESIGELISDEDLAKLVDSSLQTVFFTPRPNPKYSTWGSGANEPSMLPPLLYELMKELLLPSMKEAINAYLKEHPEEVKTALDEVLKLGVGQAMMSAISYQFNGQLSVLQNNIMTQLSQPR